jgi:hypothetical protein
MTTYICRLDLPVQVNHPAAKSLMVLPLENLMALPESPRAAGRSETADFEFRRLRDQDSNLEPTG